MSTILRVDRLTAGYGKSVIINDVSIKVRKGEIVSIVGPNGSGKSTLLKTIYCLTNIFSGKIFFDGKEITHMKPFELSRIGMGYVPQVSNIFHTLTVRENLEMGGIVREDEEAREAIEKVEKMFPILKERENVKASTLSGGLQQMLAIGRTMMSNPKLLMCDEPASSLSPKVSIKIFDILQKMRDHQGVTIMLVEQHVKRALSIADRGYVLVSGRNVLEGNSKELLNKDLGRIFLGGRNFGLKA